MTFKLSTTSTRGHHAARFGAELAKAMRARRASAQRLADATGCSRASIANWKIGGNLPTLRTAILLADALDWPALGQIVRDGRSSSCLRCGRATVAEASRNALYCSSACRSVAAQLRAPSAGSGLAAELRAMLSDGGRFTRRGVAEALDRYAKGENKRVRRVDQAAAALTALQATVAAMCASCEPEGVCRNADCPLRGASPLTLALPRNAGSIAAPGSSWDAENAPKTLAAIRSANADRWSREGERERASEFHRARHAAMTPEEREARRLAISAGRRKAS